MYHRKSKTQIFVFTLRLKAEKKDVGIGDSGNERGIILWETSQVNLLQWVYSTDREDNFLF